MESVFRSAASPDSMATRTRSNHMKSGAVKSDGMFRLPRATIAHRRTAAFANQFVRSISREPHFSGDLNDRCAGVVQLNGVLDARELTHRIGSRRANARGKPVPVE